MTTSVFSTAAAERVLPELTLDFTTANLDSRVNFTRSGDTATAINSSGNIAPISANLPRFDYNLGSGGACRGLLIEEARTNLVTNTIFNGAVAGTPGTAPTGWSLATTGSPSLAVTASLYGNLDGAQALTLTGVATQRWRCFQTFLAVSGTTYVVSIYVESVTGTSGRLVAISGVAGTDVQTITNPSSPGRYSHIWTASATGVATVQFGLGTTAGLPGNCTIAVSRIQLEAGAFATSYIPTTLTALTRDADAATMTGSNFSDWWQVGKGSALVRAIPSTVSGTRPLIQFDDTTGNNIIALRGNTTNPELYVRTGGSDQAQIDAGTIAANTSYRLAGAWATNSCSASVNSGTPVLDGVATIPVVTQARLGSDGTNYLNGHLESVDYYNERVLNAGLQVISSSTGRRSIFKPVLKTSIFA